MGAALRFLRNRSITHGVLRGHKLWIGVAVVVWGLRAFQWAWPKDESIVYRTVLQPGESLEIVHDARTEAQVQAASRRRR